MLRKNSSALGESVIRTKREQNGWLSFPCQPEVRRPRLAGVSKIEWTDSTFNPWVGCTKIERPGAKPSACDFCYAEKWAKRSGQVAWGNNPRRRTTASYWRGPLSWNLQATDFY